MKGLIRISVVAALGAGLVACGGGRGAKLAEGADNAAAALFQASGPASQSSGGDTMGQGVTSIGAQTEVKVDCSLGGTATLNMDLVQTLALTTSGQFGMVSTVKYNDCQESLYDDPKTEAIEKEPIWMNGDLSMTFASEFDTSDTNLDGEVSLKLKGKVSFSGAISDFIDADVTEYIQYSNLNADEGTVTVRLEGTISTSTTTTPYTYTGTAITITAGSLVAADTSADAGG